MADSNSKRCSVCRQLKAFTEFHKNKGSADGFSYTCKPCAIERTRKWLADNAEQAKESHRLYHQTHRADNNKRSKDWYQTNCENLKPAYRQYRETHKEQIRAGHKRWRDKNQDHVREYSREAARRDRATPERREYLLAYRRETRAKVINHYSSGLNVCLCCGESHFEFLTIDHINGGGNKHRQEVKSVYLWLVRNNFPVGFQVLCYNCNLAKGRYGYCPHEDSGVGL